MDGLLLIDITEIEINIRDSKTIETILYLILIINEGPPIFFYK